MANLLQTVSKQATRFSAKSNGVIGMVASGAGTDLVLRAADRLVLGGRAQQFAGVSVPIINISVGVIDGLNYAVHGKGKLVSKDGVIAVLGAKLLEGVITNVGGVRIAPDATLGSSSSGVSF